MPAHDRDDREIVDGQPPGKCAKRLPQTTCVALRCACGAAVCVCVSLRCVCVWRCGALAPRRGAVATPLMGRGHVTR
jgi:hypothetical protein